MTCRQLFFHSLSLYAFHFNFAIIEWWWWCRFSLIYLICNFIKFFPSLFSLLLVVVCRVLFHSSDLLFDFFSFFFFFFRRLLLYPCVCVCHQNQFNVLIFQFQFHLFIYFSGVCWCFRLRHIWWLDTKWIWERAFTPTRKTKRKKNRNPRNMWKDSK